MRHWNSFDNQWMFSLFGTAVGAGILFLPIRAGMGGFYPILVMCALIFPMVWLSHRALSRFVSEAKNTDDDITHAVDEYWGQGVGFFIMILYFFAIYPICLAYGVGITNTFESFFIHQLQITQWVDSTTNALFPSIRAILAILLVSAMMAVMILEEQWITKISHWLVYPLCLILFGFSVYLIPHWKLEILTYIPNTQKFIESIWLTLPVLVFAFNHSPAISTFTLSMQKHYKRAAKKKADLILFKTSLMLMLFIMFFVISCILCLDSKDFALAREANIPILSYFANKFNNPLISYGAPLVAFLAIVTSFFGHYFGAFEGLNGIIRKALIFSGFTPNLKIIKAFSTLFMYLSIILVAYLNPSILGFIEDLGGPIIAMILFLMPILAIWTISKLKKYKNLSLDLFVFVMGLLTISSVVYKLL